MYYQWSYFQTFHKFSEIDIRPKCWKMRSIEFSEFFKLSQSNRKLFFEYSNFLKMGGAPSNFWNSETDHSRSTEQTPQTPVSQFPVQVIVSSLPRVVPKVRRRCLLPHLVIPFFALLP